MSDAVSIFKCLGDPTRFAIMSLLCRSDSYVELLAEKLSLTPGTISHHLKKLEEAGLVRCSRAQFYMIYSVNREQLEAPIIDYLVVDDALDDDSAYRQKVYDSFIASGRLVSIPTQRKKREIICARLAEEFEPGRTYTEPEVNEILTRWHEDYCFLRRELIAFGLMERDHEVCWRVNQKGANDTGEGVDQKAGYSWTHFDSC